MGDTIIIGAGAAGLAAARALRGPVTILEARPRLGGRIHTIADPAFGIPVELGAEFIHGRPDSTWDLLREAGQTALDLPFDHRVRRRGHLVHLDDLSRELDKVMGGLARLRKDTSFADYLRTHARGQRLKDAREMATAFVQGFDAADPARISALSLAQEQEGLGDVGQETQFRPLRGYGALIEAMHQRLDPKRVRIHLRSPVTTVRWSRGQVEVICIGPRTRTFRAKRAIITVPVGVLQATPGSRGAIRFDPDVPSIRAAAAALASGPVVKVIMSFTEPFWEQKRSARLARTDRGLADAAFIHDPNAPFPTCWTQRPLRVPVITAWAGGPKADALSGRPRADLTAAALESLASMLGRTTRYLRARLQRAHAADWQADPYARGAYSYQTVGAARARSALARPIEHTLFFAGEATDTRGQASTVAGALASGTCAAAIT